MIDNRSASLANALLGAWLVVSAFLWHHSKANFVNAWLIGVVVVVSSLMAIRVPWFRFVTAAAGLWLITGLFAGGQLEAVTVWHNVMVGLGIVLASTVGRRPDSPPSKPVESNP
jgi:hypothetical protein